MAERHIQPSDLSGKVIDIHAHVGVNLKAYAAVEYPYAQTIEDLYYRQAAAGVDVNVVFPMSSDLYFDPAALLANERVRAEKPLSEAPYVVENRMLMHDIFRFCPEHRHRFLPFVSAIPAARSTRRSRLFVNWSRSFRSTGSRSCRSRARPP